MRITHAYVQQNIFPVGLAKSAFEYMLTNDVRDDTLLESFLLYVDVRERRLIKKQSVIHRLLKNIIMNYGTFF